MALKRKAMAATAAFALAALIAMGTFAWTNLNAQRLNEWRGAGANPTDSTPGGTLHDDHEENGIDKQVYVENWGDEDLFVRIRLSEYMELGPGAGLKAVAKDPAAGNPVPNPENFAKPLVNGADIDHTDAWQMLHPYLLYPTVLDKNTIYYYWAWEYGGQKYYYPAPEGSRADNNFVDQGSPANLTADSVNEAGVKAEQTRSAKIMYMSDWMASPQTGDIWVVDDDGWAYWAAPLKPGEATGLYLNKVTRIRAPEEDYYYGINVSAQMATKEGKDELDNYKSFGLDINSGWTDNGKALMEMIVHGGNGNQGKLVGNVFRVGLFRESMPENDKNIILASYNDYINYFNTYKELLVPGMSVGYGKVVDLILNKYGESFFENQSLAVTYVPLPNWDSVEYSSSTIEDNTITIGYRIHKSMTIQPLGTGFFVIVEVDKNITSVVPNLGQSVISDAVRANYFPDMPESDSRIIISNYNDYLNYFDKYIEESLVEMPYHIPLGLIRENFFDNSSLAVAYVELNYVNYSVEYASSIIEDDSITVAYKVNMPDGPVSPMMSGYFVIVEVDKAIKNIAANPVS